MPDFSKGGGGSLIHGGQVKCNFGRTIFRKTYLSAKVSDKLEVVLNCIKLRPKFPEDN